MIDESGTQTGVVPIAEALAAATAAGLDLVEIAPNANPPVAKIVDWGKWRYQQTKIEQKARKKHRVQDVKQMRFGLKIGQHDREVKLRKVRGFLEEGDKVKLSIFFRGREMAHPELGHKLLDSLVAELSDISVVDQEAQMLGKYLNLTLRKK